MKKLLCVALVLLLLAGCSASEPAPTPIPEPEGSYTQDIYELNGRAQKSKCLLREFILNTPKTVPTHMLILICLHNHLEQDGTEGETIMQMNIKVRSHSTVLLILIKNVLTWSP